MRKRKLGMWIVIAGVFIVILVAAGEDRTPRMPKDNTVEEVKPEEHKKGLVMTLFNEG